MQVTACTVIVFSDLLALADGRAGELAIGYDHARIAGQLCEETYAALTGNEEQH